MQYGNKNRKIYEVNLGNNVGDACLYITGTDVLSKLRRHR